MFKNRDIHLVFALMVSLFGVGAPLHHGRGCCQASGDGMKRQEFQAPSATHRGIWDSTADRAVRAWASRAHGPTRHCRRDPKPPAAVWSSCPTVAPLRLRGAGVGMMHDEEHGAWEAWEVCSLLGAPRRRNPYHSRCAPMQHACNAWPFAQTASCFFTPLRVASSHKLAC
jgi:hypothetical protein